MANPLKGEVSLEANGKAYTFVLGTYALAALQRRSGISTAKFFGRPPIDWGMDDVLGLVHCGLMRHHKDITEEEVADLIDAVGNEKINKIIGEGIKLAFPDAHLQAQGSRPTKLKSA